MYFQPYGDDQQLNLNWIINEIINLHKQLDPDYETPSFTQVYPYSNLNRLNLDWVLSELKTLKELAPEPTPEIDIQAVAEALVALPFDSNTSYQIYDFISRDGEIWRATEAIPAGGEWDETKWFKTKIGTDLAVLERWINTINNSLTAEIDARQAADTVINQTIANLNNAGTDNLDDCNNFVLGIKKVVPTTLNMPENAYGFIDGYTAQNGNWKWQFLTTTQTPQKIFKRANINNTGWTPWVKIADLSSADISDDSDAGGATVKASLNNLKGSLNSVCLRAAVKTISGNGTSSNTLTGLTADHVIGNWGMFSDAACTTPIPENYPTCDITITTAANSWSVTIENFSSTFYLRPTFILKQN